MSQNISLLTLSIAASAALSAHTFVGAGGAVATAAGNALGVADADTVQGALCPTIVSGTAKVIASAAIAAGAYVEVAANGQAATQDEGIAVGVALEAAEAGELVEVLLIPNAPAPAAAG